MIGVNILKFLLKDKIPQWIIDYNWDIININDYNNGTYSTPNLNLEFKIPNFKKDDYENENYTKERLFLSFVERMAISINLATNYIFHIIGGISQLKEPFKTKFLTICYQYIEWFLPTKSFEKHNWFRFE